MTEAKAAVAAEEPQELSQADLKTIVDMALIGVCEIVLTTGEHVVAEVYPPVDNTFMVRYPTVYQFFRNEEGQYIVFFKYMPLAAEALMFIRSSNIVSMNRISTDYQENYYKAVNHYFTMPDDTPRENKSEETNVVNLADWIPDKDKKVN
jgi:hypothetical protein